MAPQRRKSNTHLPPNIYFKHNAYYWVEKKKRNINSSIFTSRLFYVFCHSTPALQSFIVLAFTIFPFGRALGLLKGIKRKWHFLGKTLAEAMRHWSEMMERPLKNNRMDGVLERYLKEIAPQKASSTYKGNIHALKLLKIAFGHLYPHEITPVMVYRYMDLRKPSSLVGANKEKSLLSHVFSYAIRWGLTDKNPCADVKSFKEPKREYYIPDDDFWNFYHFVPITVKNAMYLDLLICLRLGDLLKIQLPHLTEKGLEIKTSKTGKTLLFEWNESLETAIKQIKESRGNVKSLYLICNESGQKYSEDGFKTVWQYWMRKAVKEGIVKIRFQFKDIRKKAATDIENTRGIIKAQKALGHTSSKTTDSVYVVGVRKVKIRNVEIKKKANDVDK